MASLRSLLLLSLGLAAPLIAGCEPEDDCSSDFECEDDDDDGFCASCGLCQCHYEDCNDEDAATYPHARDAAGDGDRDCDGGDLGEPGSDCEADGECASGHCNADRHSCTLRDERCIGGADEDEDGAIDCLDADCAAPCAESLAATCAAAAPLGAGFSGTLEGAGSTTHGSCSFGAGPERILAFAVAPGETGTLTLKLHADWYAYAVYARTACTDTASEVGCAAVVTPSALGGYDALLRVVVHGTEARSVFIDASENLYASYPLELTASFAVAICGDGVPVGPEACDDGGTLAGDGCDPSCAAEDGFDPCLVAIPAAEGVTAGDTRTGTAVASGSCTGEGGVERVHVFVPEESGRLYAVLDSVTDQGLYARSGSCDPAGEVACTHVEGASEIVEIDVIAGEPAYLFVDSRDVAEAGPYTLTLVPLPP